MRRLLLLIALIAGFVVPGAAPASAAQRDPVLFVHGFSGGSFNWWTMRSWFQADGWDRTYNWSYDSTRSNVTTAYEIRDEVNRIKRETGATKVDIISHSMGGLSSRYYLKNLGGTASVDDWVSIGGPNHGTGTAYACFTTSCVDMRFGSPFLTALNSGDETPGTVEYGTFRSWCDEIINPDDSTVLSGATNTQVGCYGHLALLGSWNVYTQVREFVRY